MIKLFWNTHNQKKPNSPEKKIREKQELDYGWGKYHKKSSDKWVFEILKKVEYQIIKSEEELKKEDVLIIVDSSVEEKSELYNKLNLISSKIFLFHLGDEFGFHNLSTVYNSCDYVWRPFCSSKYFNNEKVTCIPIGYKSGVLNKETTNRKYNLQELVFQHGNNQLKKLTQLYEGECECKVDINGWIYIKIHEDELKIIK